jgi:hypothetical protein
VCGFGGDAHCAVIEHVVAGEDPNRLRRRSFAWALNRCGADNPGANGGLKYRDRPLRVTTIRLLGRERLNARSRSEEMRRGCFRTP